MPKASLIALTAVLVGACTVAPPDRGTLPDVGEALDPPVACSFLVGPPRGVSVDEVLADTGADGVLEAGDVIVAINGLETIDSDHLRDALSEQSVGDAIDIDLLRDGTDTSTEMILGPNPDDPDRPFMGVMIRTAYDQMEPAEAEATIPQVATSRAVVVGGLLYGVEPSQALWSNTKVGIAEDTNWVATSESVFGLSTGDDRVLTDILSGEVINYPVVDGWTPARLIGSIDGDLLIAVTQEVPDQPELVAVATARFDPETGDTEWIEPISEGFGVPVTAWASPGGDFITIGGVEPDTATLSGVDMLTSEGVTAGLDELLGLGSPIGWLDDETAAFRTSVTTISEVNAVTGKVTEVTLDDALEGVPLYAVADGHSVLAVSDRSLLLDDLTTDNELRVLAENCSLGRIGDTGWRP